MTRACSDWIDAALAKCVVADKQQNNIVLRYKFNNEDVIVSNMSSEDDKVLLESMITGLVTRNDNTLQ